MIIDDIKHLLENKGYKNIIVNIANIFLYYNEKNEKISIIFILDCRSDNFCSKDQYEYILKQIRNNFETKKLSNSKILSIICTDQIEQTKNLSDAKEIQWFIDISYNRLVIYENQENAFMELRNKIENLLYYTENSSIQNKEKIESAGYSQDDSIYTKNESYNDNSNHINTEEYNNDSYNYIKSERKGKQRLNNVIKHFSLCNTIIIVVNILMYLIVESTGSSLDSNHMLDYGAMYWPDVKNQGEYYRLFTYMFLHFGTSHLLNNMVILGFIGDNLERAIGKIRYAIIYLGTGLIAGIVSMSYNMMKGTVVVSAGASGAIFGIVGAMLYVLFINKGRLEDLSTTQILLFAILSLYGGFTSQGIDNVAHVGGFVAGILISILLYRKPKKREVENR